MANRVLLGKRGTSDYGLYVSRPTEDVTSTSSGLIFDSNNAQKGFNVVAKGQGILNHNTARTFSHGLGFRPFIEVTYTNVANMIGSGPTSAATFNVTLTYNSFLNAYFVSAVTVSSGGSGYTTAPGLSFSGTGQISPASATATISGGAVTSVTVTSGGYYTTSTAPTCTPLGGGPPAYASKVYKAYNGDRTPYSSLGSGGAFNAFQDVFQLVNQPQQGDEEWDLDYDEGVFYQTTTSNLTIRNSCNGGSYREFTGGTTTHNSSYSGQTIYYSYIIFNCESPFV